MSEVVEVEKVLEGTFDCVFPVTIIKYILNQRKILTIFRKIQQDTFKSSYTPFTLDNSKCKFCEDKKEMKVKCRMHTSIDRVLSTMQVIIDPETGIMMYKNEIFQLMDPPDKVGIIYCPHTKMVPETGPLNSSRVKKVTPFVFQLDGSKLPEFSTINFNVNEIKKMKLKYWFSPEYYLITEPSDTEVGFTLQLIK